jgi:hypothetical protein
VSYDLDISHAVDSISLHIQPSIAGKYILPQDWLLLQMVTNNRWKRPIFFAITVAPQNMNWLNDYSRPEGLVQRVIPQKSPRLNTAIITENLLIKYNYRGYADDGVVIDDFSRMIAFNYYSVALQLASEENARGDFQSCKNIRDAILNRLPPFRLEPLPQHLKLGLEAICSADSINQH